MTGEWPVGDVDHKNTDGKDNRIANLREATQGQNTSNSRLRRDNACGFKGVVRTQCKVARWTAYINKDGQRHYLGVFQSPELAAKARADAAAILHGEFTRSA
jgi:hypothetical protein